MAHQEHHDGRHTESSVEAVNDEQLEELIKIVFSEVKEVAGSHQQQGSDAPGRKTGLANLCAGNTCLLGSV